MGQPKWIRTLPYHEIGEVRTLSHEENRIGGAVPIDCVNYQTCFSAAVMP